MSGRLKAECPQSLLNCLVIASGCGRHQTALSDGHNHCCNLGHVHAKQVLWMVHSLIARMWPWELLSHLGCSPNFSYYAQGLGGKRWGWSEGTNGSISSRWALTDFPFLSTLISPRRIHGWLMQLCLPGLPQTLGLSGFLLTRVFMVRWFSGLEAPHTATICPVPFFPEVLEEITKSRKISF